MMKGGHRQTNQLCDINWGALDHVSRAPQLMSCNYCACVCVCVGVNVAMCGYVCVCMYDLFMLNFKDIMAISVYLN